jgi:hypothetical protein
VIPEKRIIMKSKVDPCCGAHISEAAFVLMQLSDSFISDGVSKNEEKMLC